MRCVVVGGITTVDRGAADDKIIAVLEGDALWGDARDIGGVPEALVNRLRHYFATYKSEPGSPIRVDVRDTYGAARAHDVIRAALADYGVRYGSGDASQDR